MTVYRVNRRVIVQGSFQEVVSQILFDFFWLCMCDVLTSVCLSADKLTKLTKVG